MVIEAGVNVVCRDEAFWLTESDWCFKKVFHMVFDVLVTHEVFLSLTVFAFEGKENALLFCHNRQLFFQATIIFATNFCELVHRKTFVLPTDCCFWKKDLKIKAERRRNHWRQKRVVFQKTFWTSPRKTGNFEGIVFFLCLVNEISRKSFPNNYRSVEAKFILSKETLKTVNEFAFCLLIGQIGSSFFLWKKCFVSQLFFLAFKRTLLIVLLQVRRMKVKATMRQISFGQKIKGKGKKLQYGWVSECWLWYDIGWALKVIANETQVLRTSPDT